MISGSPFAFNFLFLLFLLVPGYLSLRGYLSATIQLDTVSRLDKILTAVIGGIVTFAIMIILYRFGVLQFIVNVWYGFWSEELTTVNIGYNSANTITVSNVRNTSALGLVGFITAQSILAYSISYLLGTIAHIRSSKPQKSDKDIQQPWETAFRQSALGDRVTVITIDGNEIRGKIYRIGSPSEDYDLLLSAAERVVRGGDHEPLGMTYHHHKDISQVRFPDIKPDPPGEDGNWILRQTKRIRNGPNSLKYRYNRLRYRKNRLKEKLQNAAKAGTLLTENIHSSQDRENK